MTDQREAIAQAIHVVWVDHDLEYSERLLLASADAVLPLVAEAEHRGYWVGHEQALVEARAKITAHFDNLAKQPRRDICAPWARSHALAVLDELQAPAGAAEAAE